MARLAITALLIGLAGCGGPKLPTGLVPGAGGSCATQADCSGCSQCRPAGEEVCLSKACYLASKPDAAGEPTLTDGMVTATLPSGTGSQVKGAAVRIYYPLRADGSTVTCQALLAHPTVVDGDGSLNVLRSLTPSVSMPGTTGQVSFGANELPVGTDRLALVVFYSQAGGTGSVVADGCTEHLTLSTGAPCQGAGDCPYPAKCEKVSGRSECGPQQIVVRTTRP